jgi:hypothetical protein
MTESPPPPPPAVPWAAAFGCAISEKWNCGRAATSGALVCGDGVCGDITPVEAIANASGES